MRGWSDSAARRAYAQRHIGQLTAKILERRVFQMHVIQNDIAARQLNLDIAHVEHIVGDMDIRREPPERQATVFIKRETLDTDVKVVILEAGQSQVSTQIAHCQVIDVKSARLHWLVKHVIDQSRLAQYHRLDLDIEGLGRFFPFRLEGIDDELHVGRAVLIGTRHMAGKTRNLSIGDDDATVGHQMLETDACAQLVDGEQRVALLIVDKDIVELDLVEWRYRHRTNADLGIQELAKRLFPL